MTKHEIISNLYLSKPFNDYVKRMEPIHLREDLKQEVTIILLEQSEEKIKSINATGGLLFYTFRIMLNLVRNNKCKFYKLYLTPTTDKIPEIEYPEMNGRAQKELNEEKALMMIDGLYWYDREIIRLYLRLGSYAAVEKETGIPRVSCCRTTLKAIKQIRDEIGL